jgi:hypothetical protein
MCNFFSLVITKTGLYHLIKNQSHADIIKEYGLQKEDNGFDLVKIEAIPIDYNTMSEFDIKIDQDIIPNWFNLEADRDEILKAIRKYSLKELQLAAVNQNGHAINYIENPSEKLKLAAVEQNWFAIRYIENPSEKLKLAAANKIIKK